MINELEHLANMYNCDKGTTELEGHGYTDIYYEHWKNIRQNVKAVLEIGILRGASIKTLRDFFPNAIIYGVDVSDGVPGGRGEAIGDLYDQGRVNTYLCDQTDNVKLNELFKDISFDIILDDGGHNTLYQQKSLGYLFKFVKPGGMYIVEDLHTSLMGSDWGLPPEDSYTCLSILRNAEKTNKIDTPHINQKDINYINENIASVQVFDTKRTVPVPPSPHCQVKCDLTSIIMKREK